MTWHDVLDSKIISAKSATRDKFAVTAHDLGYKFFAFNGSVYFVAINYHGDLEHWDTGITTEQLDQTYRILGAKHE